MVDCPCGLGRNIDPEGNCPSCGMDLSPLYHLNRAKEERELNIKRVLDLEKKLSQVKKALLILPVAAFIFAYIIKPPPGPAVEAAKLPPPTVQAAAQPKPIEIVVEKQRFIYTVKAGDSLSKIAYNFYGDSSRWDKVYEANKTILPNPHSISTGQQLLIPE